MPIYEYKCEKGHVLMVRQGYEDFPLQTCMECGAPTAKVPTLPTIIFRGDGWAK